jgi:hypothetical protein
VPPTLTYIILVFILLGSGCTDGRLSYLDHKMVIDKDNLTVESFSPKRGQFDIDLQIVGFERDRRLFYTEILNAIKEHPGLSIRNLSGTGMEAFRLPKIKQSRSALWTVKIELCHEFIGHWWNYFMGFPGMVLITPTWWGYYYELDMRCTGEIQRVGRGTVTLFEADKFIELREKNAPRSVAFHYWPSNGVLGTQFALGVFMALDLMYYKRQYSTPLLIKVLGKRFGQSFASDIYRQLSLGKKKKTGLDEKTIKAFRLRRKCPFPNGD